ncbi:MULTISPECIES: ABC transporter substrate-binding protein [unclassified Mesorhizobium]|uniref:ABC transporter substrate-binding protein n=1 Tax=unclassified Mesorhizobium TaxID=325217 RepID=UPI000FD8A5E3|nr:MULTISPECIES: ABC transporter substrate-binding protein [unclassified Mesorhizobium]TGT73366.1 ABC transporter substrate-binding protein [Mesorhizobium sp. M2E.F.Ca.ET.166.01.1.1]TGV99882.1 ABC transporter substrate-binding protein [Mesorhizobium sp. M2E.F.Ca.ET.154.01.1.1]
MTKRNEIDALRNLSGDIWNVAVDEYAKGYLKRRDLLKYAALIGLTGFAASQGLGFSRARAAAAGGTVRVGLGQPTKAIDPVTVTDPASIGVLSQVGEYLILDDPKDGLQPKLALSWEADETAKRWTFKLRPGAKFHDGRTVTAKDVVASFERLVDPNSGSSALSAYKGILSKGGAKIVDDETVAFDLDQSNSNFPFYVSSDVYNAVILPADYAGDFEKNFNGTGPFKLESFRPKQGASFVRNPDYWGDKALPDRVEIKFFDDEQAQVVALQAGQLDVIPSTTRLELAIEGNANFKLLSVQASSHDVVHLRTDQAPFTDKRVRRALALTLDREAIVKGLLKGRAIVGNDTPFAPIFPSADPSVPQRKQDIAEAKRLLGEAGVPNGFEVTLTTERAYDIPDYAVIIQNFAKKAGIDIKLNVLPQDAYYGSATFGSSPWLDSNLGITDFGHRGTPDIFLNATLKSDGAWNAAHFKNADYDALLVEYGKARDLQTQRIAAGKIQTLLLDETPEIISYFSQYSRIASAKVEGVRFTAISHLLLDRVSFVQA